MRRLRLTTTAHAHVEHLCKPPPDRRLRDRCQAVLLASRGRQRKRIAQALGGHRTTVRLWLQQSQARGVTGVQIHWAPGQPGRLPETLAPTIQAWGQAGPQRWGRDRAHWTYAELAPSLDQTTGIAVKRTALRVFCQRHAIRPSRPTYRSRRGDPAPQQGAQGALAA